MRGQLEKKNKMINSFRPVQKTKNFGTRRF